MRVARETTPSTRNEGPLVNPAKIERVLTAILPSLVIMGDSGSLIDIFTEFIDCCNPLAWELKLEMFKFFIA